uniref:Zinc finger protein 239-like n=1 Tax=Cyprinodon variegatus TaxID=28743 RepID=A0A3Q2DFK3_CYPVA
MVAKDCYETNIALVKHAWRHSEEAGSVCGVCGASVQVLKDHLQSEHRTDEGPNCGLAVLHLNEDLKGQPVELTHPPEDNHSSFLSELPSEDSQELQESCHRCPTCQKVFELEARLKAHCRTHSTCKTYLCGVCGKFLSSNRLLIHMRTHTDEKPYHCNRCGKGFTTRGPLTIHMRVHTGETPYRCPHLGMTPLDTLKRGWCLASLFLFCEPWLSLKKRAVIIALHKSGLTGKRIAARLIALQLTIYRIIKN